ncbi:MAG: tRNA (adenosine(37)-N6)-dimethylallyltransferase MiaA [Acidobacteria bacterium]|nr:MAG: tRNA (adenosine(37)-N6)-dimethylallyltransferase MiaA [Acidobacteriota bacterium]
MESTPSGHRPIIAVVGPTASGKSELGIAIAVRFDGEIINCDSVQVYRRLIIGTAKVPPEERRGVPHHLIDIVEPTEHFTAGDYARLAGRTIQRIEARGKLPILVGGTGFYLRALREPLFDSPPTDLALRQRLHRLLERHGPEHLHRLLARVDPASAERIAPRDWSRTMRALEFYFQTGEPISRHLERRPAPPPFAARLRLIALHPPRDRLYQRINERTERMFARGWVDEVRQLLESGVPPTAKALGAHGYRRIVQYVQGEIPLERAIELTKRDVRHYAKRQLTWFRREPHVTWFEGFGDDPQVQARVIEFLERLIRG